MNQEAPVRRIGWTLAVAGVVLAALAGFLAMREADKTDDWVETEGVVIEVKKTGDVFEGTTIRYYSIETVNGEETEVAREFASDYGSLESRRGEKVPIKFDPANPWDSILKDGSIGTPGHVYFVIGFGLLALWGIAIALSDPQLSPLTGRPEGLAFTSLWLVLTSVIGVLALKDTFTGITLVLMWLMAALGIVIAFGLWRMMQWARWAALSYSAVVAVLMVVAWARNDNRFGAPLFWNLILLGIWALVILVLTRSNLVGSFARAHAKAVAAR